MELHQKKAKMFYLHPSFYSSEMGQIYSFKYFLWKKKLLRTIIENKWTCCSFKCYEQISQELPFRISDQHSLFCLLSLTTERDISLKSVYLFWKSKLFYVFLKKYALSYKFGKTSPVAGSNCTIEKNRHAFNPSNYLLI